MPSSSLALAARTLAILATHPEGVVTSDELGTMLEANPVVVRRLIARLRADGLVETRRGPGGGCALGMEPDRVTLGRVDRALGGEREPTSSPWPLDEAEAAYRAVLARSTLADVLARRDS